MEPQGTHVPVLIAIGKMYPNIKTVMEYGSGEFSTLTFLNKEYFPNLAYLTSTESQPEWADDTRKRVGDDDLGWDLISYTEDGANGIDPVTGEPYKLDADETEPDLTASLIMIDSLTGASRVRTLNKLRRANYQGIIVVHDSQDHYYGGSLAQFPHRHQFMIEVPWTDVLSIAQHFIGDIRI